jgi:hypothetical protein
MAIVAIVDQRSREIREIGIISSTLLTVDE